MRELNLPSTKHLDLIPFDGRYIASHDNGQRVTHMCVRDKFIVTGSDNGIKIWHKTLEGLMLTASVDFVSPLRDLSVSPNGQHVCTVLQGSYCVYNIHNGMLVHNRNMPFLANSIVLLDDMDLGECCVFSQSNGSRVALINLATGHLLKSVLLEGRSSLMKLNKNCRAIIVALTNGALHYMSVRTLRFPDYCSETMHILDPRQTDLLSVADANATISGLEISPDGSQFCVSCSDHRIRVYFYKHGGISNVIDEMVQMPEGMIYPIPGPQRPNAVFDISSNFLVRSCSNIIVIYNLRSSRAVRYLGNTDQEGIFHLVGLSQSAAWANPDGQTIYATGADNSRLYVFSRHRDDDVIVDIENSVDVDDDDDDDDDFNEKYDFEIDV